MFQKSGGKENYDEKDFGVEKTCSAPIYIHCGKVHIHKHAVQNFYNRVWYNK